MQMNRKLIAIAGAIAALGAGGVGIAQAVGGGDSEESITGPNAERAKRAALKAVGGGTVTEVERQEGNEGGFEVEVRRDDGTELEVRLNDRFQASGTVADDASGSESSDGGNGDR